MSITRNPNLRGNAKKLRKNMTDEEKKLWYTFLNGLSVRFKRQQVIGEYIVDFYCPSEKIIIELDGFQHNFDEKILESDKQRDSYFRNCNVKVLRYSNVQINEDFRNVCDDIKKHLSAGIQ